MSAAAPRTPSVRFPNHWRARCTGCGTLIADNPTALLCPNLTPYKFLAICPVCGHIRPVLDLKWDNPREILARGQRPIQRPPRRAEPKVKANASPRGAKSQGERLVARSQ